MKMCNRKMIMWNCFILSLLFKRIIVSNICQPIFSLLDFFANFFEILYNIHLYSLFIESNFQSYWFQISYHLCKFLLFIFLVLFNILSVEFSDWFSSIQNDLDNIKNKQKVKRGKYKNKVNTKNKTKRKKKNASKSK